MVILRLVSQLLQDIAKNKQSKLFVGFLESEVFMIAGEKEQVDSAVTDLARRSSTPSSRSYCRTRATSR